MKLLLFIMLTLSLTSAHALIVKDGKVTLEKLSDYELCQSRSYAGDLCHQALIAWVDSNPQDAFKAGKLTRKHMNPWAATPFFLKALEQPDMDCYDADLRKALSSADEQPADLRKDIRDQAKQIREKCKSIKKSKKRKKD